MASLIFGVRLDRLETVDQLDPSPPGSSTATGRSGSSRRTPRSSCGPAAAPHTRTCCARPTSRSPTARASRSCRLRDGQACGAGQASKIAAFLVELAAERGETVAFVGGVPDVCRARGRQVAGNSRPEGRRRRGRRRGGRDGSATCGAGGRDDRRDPLRRRRRSCSSDSARRSRSDGSRAMRTRSSVRVMIGVGGAFDMWAELQTPRAPRLPNARARGGCGGWRSNRGGCRDHRDQAVAFPVLAVFDRTDE